MLLVLASVLLSCETLLCNANVIAMAGNNESVNEFNILKQGLRRNNDDYKDGTLVETLHAKDKPLYNKIDRDLTESPDPLYARAEADAGAEAGAEAEAGAGAEAGANGTRATRAKSKRFSKVAREAGAGAGAAAGAEAPRKLKNLTRVYPKYVNKERSGKLVQFLDKYRNRVDEFISDRGLAPAAAAAPTPAPAPAPVPRAAARVPSGRELDMSPAVGNKVHSLRNKNQLCHRHVMLPEGPKYDSKGRIYLAEFRAEGHARNYDYHQTRRPELLLPRCCNCCKKSALGCE